MKVAELLAT